MSERPSLSRDAASVRKNLARRFNRASLAAGAKPTGVLRLRLALVTQAR